MQKIRMTRSPLASQRVQLDISKTEYIIKTRWVSLYQRFYMSIYDTQGNQVLGSIKLVAGCPVNLGNYDDTTPQGLFVLVGKGKMYRRAFEAGAYTLYYIERGKNLKFPLIREYTINNDVQEFLLNNTPVTFTDAGIFRTYLDDESFLFLTGENFEYLGGEYEEELISSRYISCSELPDIYLDVAETEPFIRLEDDTCYQYAHGSLEPISYIGAYSVEEDCTCVIAPTEEDYNTLLLNGSNQSLNLGQNALLTLGNGDKSHSIWFKTTSSASMMLFVQGTASANDNYFDIYMASGQIYARVDDGALNKYGRTNSTYNDGQWHHLVVLWNSLTTYQFFIDGIQAASTMLATGAVSFIGNGGVDLGIGYRVNTNSLFFNGSLTNALYFNKTLSAPEITELYNSGKPKQPLDYSAPITSSYIFALPLNTGVTVGTECDDVSLNGLDGTKVGAPTITGDLITYDI